MKNFKEQGATVDFDNTSSLDSLCADEVEQYLNVKKIIKTLTKYDGKCFNFTLWFNEDTNDWSSEYEILY